MDAKKSACYSRVLVVTELVVNGAQCSYRNIVVTEVLDEELCVPLVSEEISSIEERIQGKKQSSFPVRYKVGNVDNFVQLLMQIY